MLNAKTIADRFPLPRIDDLLESIPRGCGRYSISDIADAFFKCELKEEHRHKTAFKTHNRHLQFAVLPQGFINSPSIFCRLIARTFEGMDRTKFSAYIDDVLNHCDELGDHLKTQQSLYDRLRTNQLTLKLSKTHLYYREVKFLGHILTKEGRLPDPEAVEAILEWRDPSTTKEVRSFLGATLYYREYIHQYADMAMPLYKLIRKGVIVSKEWDQERHGKAVQNIKEALTRRPVLMAVDVTKPFRLKVDACRVGRGIGGILEQKNDKGKWQPVSFYSSALRKEERNYSATELECKALHDCILHWAIYLKYIPHFEVFSDHNALRYMVNSENATTNGRLMRYLLDLQEYNFTIYYRRGTENCDADAVSRLLRTSDKPNYLNEDDLCTESGIVSKQILHRARALDKRNKEAEERLKRERVKAKEELEEMSRLNDMILAEGVENLESQSGRDRFLKNLKKEGMKCDQDYLAKTLQEMREDRGETDREEVKLDINEDNNEEMVNFLQIVSKNIPEDEGWEEKKEGDPAEERDEKEGRLVEDSMAINTAMLEGTRRNPSDWRNKRSIIKERCSLLGKTVLVTTRGSSNGRKELEREYSLRTNKETDGMEEELMDQPNWKRKVVECELGQVNAKLISSRKKGYDKLEVRTSLVPGDSGQGLFAKKTIKEKEVICTYEGLEVSESIVNELFRNNDYVASAIKNQKTKEIIYIDGIQEESCYGRFAQDPIDESLVNAKILWRENKMVLVATSKIEDGEEVYVDYGLDYWRTRIGLLHPRLRRIMNQRWDPNRKVRFDTECQMAEYDGKEAARKIKIQKESEPLKRISPNYITRVKREKQEEDLIGEDCYPNSPPMDEDRFDFNNVDECEELAEELQFPNGRKFIDEGRLYEIFQIRYDPEFERIIGFRKVLGSKPHREDGGAFLVYGREGLYELSERYLLDHSEEREEVDWPRDNYEWAVKQREDGRLANIFEQIEKSGGNELVIGRHKYVLVHTKQVNYPMLVRKDENHRKGTVNQTMVPGRLVKKTMRLHHEGYGHMGANRMLETIRLRYFWIGMEAEINQHCRDCINCKLSKSYQRRPRVPLMKYEDTSRPLDRVHVDLTGPLPVTTAKNKYILVIKDYLTKYVWLVPL